MIFSLTEISFVILKDNCRREVEQLVARRAHNPKVEGSNPSLATNFLRVCLFCKTNSFFKNGIAI